MTLQLTRYERLQQRGRDVLAGWLGGTWRRRSFSILSLLGGFYAGSNLTVYYLQKIGQRPLVVLVLVLVLEVLVRIRSHLRLTPSPLPWLMVDNARIGVVYAVVIEAFKVGS
ncbi:DUF565 domain-containing protein [Synechococcus sp. RSCCF101]|uniref:DUF565 domain-containing protein n=1 Tax=Synechococcus sp. RSCCF101 TaxID=2511069 RepID=UPI0012463CE0|nr:DUF565 domain-containing protein [Synechococcus sp. RSCCF101]QEY31759.1 DUF565 domain-containing protein [Synechococcus sp. RSCCF101]